MNIKVKIESGASYDIDILRTCLVACTLSWWTSHQIQTQENNSQCASYAKKK